MNRYYQTFAMAVLAALATGCATTDPVGVEADFGNSVRNMIQAQTADPVTAASPDPNGVEAADGPLTENVLRSYRGSVANPEDVKQDIVINVAQ